MKKLLAGSFAALFVLTAGSAMALTQTPSAVFLDGIAIPAVAQPIGIANVYGVAGSCAYDLTFTSTDKLASSSTDCIVFEQKAIPHTSCPFNNFVNFSTLVTTPLKYNTCEAYDTYGQIVPTALFLGENPVPAYSKIPTLSGFAYFDFVPAAFSVTIY